MSREFSILNEKHGPFSPITFLNSLQSNGWPEKLHARKISSLSNATSLKCSTTFFPFSHSNSGNSNFLRNSLRQI